MNKQARKKMIKEIANRHRAFDTLAREFEAPKPPKTKKADPEVMKIMEEFKGRPIATLL